MSSSAHRSREWEFLVAVGVVSLIAGIVLIVWSGPSLVAIGVILGLDLIIMAAVHAFDAAFAPLAQGHRLATALIAAVEAVAGVLLLVRPSDSLAVIAVVLGICFVAVGVLRLLALDRGHRGPLLVRSAIDIGIGGVLIIWPEFGLKSFAIVAGIGFVAHGALAVAAGLELRHEPAAADPAPPGTPSLA